MSRLRPLLLSLLLLAPLVGPVELSAQASGSLRVSLPGGEGATFEVHRHRGYPAVDAAALRTLGWELSLAQDPHFLLRHRTGLELAMREGSPFLRWDGELLQMVHEPYRVGARTFLPVQLVVDLFPGLLPNAYRFDAELGILQVEGASIDDAPDPRPADRPVARIAEIPELRPGGAADRAADRAAVTGTAPAGDRAPFVVVIDPGHGGDDTGAVGPGGTREKDVALAVALALSRELADRPDIEVRLTRDGDRIVPLWERGELATQWKGDRPGVFLSIHANALAERPGVRGFETYFLSEARTEHERRVAAAENAPLRTAEDGDAPPFADDPLLASILRDLRTFDHQHWSSLLAEMVQRELSSFHPGPDRGVKQGPFAVITNAMMPSVLIEVGFITNPEEERLLTRPDFHRDTARAIARSVDAFFQRYPPGGRE